MTDAVATGSCLCGKVRVTLTAEPLAAGLCHCTHCQKTAGSAFSIFLVVAADSVRIDGELSAYDDTGDSGETLTRKFCGGCGAPIESAGRPLEAQGVRVIKAGVFVGERDFTPQMEIYCDSRRVWTPALAGTASFPGMPPA
jgi:hypothetical protein